ncbi:unnamed protein product [Zymoseptoria tritici ST99CH_3D7]|uniref:Carbonyl reductase n=1 Tax=Zymoseptoria tritici (strain ST99CH_3D7) TaxID=1276538 RepID=A0A1X7RJ78_ZYMT9|nr:unnamed protein product [Zymoseptoria tritici ST99CH_3D7]
MSVKSRVAAVTGANKGIGLAIVRGLALAYPTSPLAQGPFQIYLTARSSQRGAEAVKTLHADPELKAAKVLVQDGGDTTISFHALDISQSSSIREFRDFLREQHPDGIDAVINNAGIAMEGFDANVVRKTLETNYYGTLEASQSLLPLLREGGRLVNVSSKSGVLNKYSEEVTTAFREAAKTSIDAVTAVMQRFQKAIDENRVKEDGFPEAAYAVSKAGETAFTKVLAMEESQKGRGVLVNACCPGYTNTDMTKGRGRKTVEEGAKTPIKLALEDIGGTFGEFWEHEEVSEW